MSLAKPASNHSPLLNYFLLKGALLNGCWVHYRKFSNETNKSIGISRTQSEIWFFECIVINKNDWSRAYGEFVRTHGCIDVFCLIYHCFPNRFMYMAENVKFWLTIQTHLPKIAGPCANSFPIFVSDLIWRTMGCQNVDFFRNTIPYCLFMLFIILKSISNKIRSIGRPEYFDSFDLNRTML